jgi:hypothetical protein
MKYLILAAIMILVIAAVSEAITAQRSLFLVAKNDLSVVDDMQSRKILGTIAKGQKTRILKCDDSKHYIMPVVALSNGTTGVVYDVDYYIVVERTGLLSWPQFLNCPYRE